MALGYKLVDPIKMRFEKPDEKMTDSDNVCGLCKEQGGTIKCDLGNSPWSQFRQNYEFDE